MPESFSFTCSCEVAPGTTAPDLAPYVVSLQGLYGIITLNGTGVLEISTSGNTINFGLAAGAGLGTVTSIAASSSNSNLVIGGSPVTTFGTLAFSLAGALNSISGLVTAADKMIYTTAADTYAVTGLTSFARTLLDDAAAVNARSTLGLVIGTDVQAFSQELSDFVTNASWAGVDLTLAGSVTVATTVTAGTDVIAGSNIEATLGSITAGNDITAGGIFTGDGSGITNLNVDTAVGSGTLAVANGGTNIASYAVGDLIHATGATTLTKLPSVSEGSYLRSAGVTTAIVWSTLKLPNSATTGDLLYANSPNNISNLADVATGNALISGGVGVAPAWGKITSSHVNSTIPTISAGVNSDITSFFGPITFSDTVTVSSDMHLSGGFYDSTDVIGDPNNVLISNGGGTEWSTGLSINTLVLNTNFGLEGTITGAGTTGAQTINKPCGTVRFAAGASSLVVTNSLCTTSHKVLAMACTNDTTATVKNVVTTTGAFTITLEAAATAETEVYWELRQIT